MAKTETVQKARNFHLVFANVEEVAEFADSHAADELKKIDLTHIPHGQKLVISRRIAELRGTAKKGGG